MAVYFIAAPDLGHVKIGFSECPERRLTKIASDSAAPVALVAVVHGGVAVEEQYHREFADDRLHGEWFSLTPRIQAVIDANPYIKRERVRQEDIAKRVGLHRSHICNVMSGKKQPNIETALVIYEMTGRRFGLIRNGSPEDIEALRRLFESSKERDAEAA